MNIFSLSELRIVVCAEALNTIWSLVSYCQVISRNDEEYNTDRQFLSHALKLVPCDHYSYNLT